MSLIFKTSMNWRMSLSHSVSRSSACKQGEEGLNWLPRTCSDVGGRSSQALTLCPSWGMSPECNLKTNSLHPGLAEYGPWAKAGPRSAFVDKDSWNTRCLEVTPSLTFLVQGQHWALQQRPRCPQSLEHLLSDLYRESLPSSFLEFSSTDRQGHLMLTRAQVSLSRDRAPRLTSWDMLAFGGRGRRCPQPSPQVGDPWFLKGKRVLLAEKGKDTSQG